MLTQIDLVKKYNLKIRGHIGQHLLIDPNTQRKIVDLLKIEPGDPVLEIGPGLGALSAHLLERGAHLIVIEKDKVFSDILQKEFGRPADGPSKQGSLTILNADILKTSFQHVVESSPFHGKKFKLISNLPYYITAPIILHTLYSRELFTQAVFTMQKEVAERLVAMPSSKAYGRLTLTVRYYCQAKLLFDISKTCFAPPPDVDSSVALLDFSAPPQAGPQPDENLLFLIIKIAFNQRRKTLLHNLLHSNRFSASREDYLKIFATSGFSEKVRGEELLLKDFLRLTQELSSFQN